VQAVDEALCDLGVNTPITGMSAVHRAEQESDDHESPAVDLPELTNRVLAMRRLPSSELLAPAVQTQPSGGS
jgi:hypothetical protein